MNIKIKINNNLGGNMRLLRRPLHDPIEFTKVGVLFILAMLLITNFGMAEHLYVNADADSTSLTEVSK